MSHSLSVSKQDGSSSAGGTLFLPYLGCLAAILIWSGWIVLSRHGARTTLSPIDLSFIRFTTALICSVPLWFFYRWHRIPLHRLLLVCWTSGVVYTTFCFAGMATAKAATAGVLINGLLPVFGALIAWLWSRATITPIAAACILGVLLADAMLIGGAWQTLGTPQGMLAIVLFSGASLSFSFYAVAVKKWNFSVMDLVVWIPIVNFISILPFWLFWQTGIPAASLGEIGLQAVFQGVVVTLGAGFLIAYTIGTLGPAKVTLFMASVPGVTALLGFVVLDEPLTVIEAASVFVCMSALIVNSRWGAARVKPLSVARSSASGRG